MIWVVSVDHNSVLYSDVKKARLCEVIKMADVRLPTECILFGLRNVYNASGRWEGNHALRYHLYLVPEDMDLTNVGAFTWRLDAVLRPEQAQGSFG